MTDTVDRALHRKVEQVGTMVDRVSQEIGHVSAEVTLVSATQRQTQSDLAQLRADFLAYTQASERRANIQRAETKLGNLADQLEHEFGHYKVVRRTAVGLLQAFDLGLVSEDAVRSISEQLMIQTPRYWLAPALVALSAWSADDRSLCDRAVAEAYRRSPDKTSLLFTLVLRRQGRTDASVRWLAHYLRAQDPAGLGRDFAVILEAGAQGAFGPAGRTLVETTLADWREVLSDDAAERDQVARWRREVESLRPAPAGGDFPALSAVSPEWPALAEALRGAEGHEPLLAKYQAMMAEEIAPQDRIEDAMDDILDRLVREYDSEELPVQRELAYHQAVVDTDGDLSAARARADAGSAAYEERLSYLHIQSNAALDPGAIGVSRATQRVAVASCRAWFGRAHQEATSAYRAQLPTDVGVAFGGSHNLGAQTFSLPDWSGKLSQGLPALEQGLAAHWDTHTEAYVQSLAFPVAKKVVGPAIVTLILLVIGISTAPGGLLLPLVVGGIWGFALYRQYQAGLAAQEQAREVLARWKQESITQLRAASAELTDWGARFAAADAHDEDVRAFITHLETAGHTAAPYERRTLATGGIPA